MPTLKMFVLSLTAGALIGLGAMLMTNVGGAAFTLATTDPGLANLAKGAVGLPMVSGTHRQRHGQPLPKQTRRSG